MNKIEIANLINSFANLIRAHAELCSGAYKLSKSEVGHGKGEDGVTFFRPMTEEEKFKAKWRELQAHADRIYDVCKRHL